MTDRWRPRLRTVFVLVHAGLLILPIAGIILLRLYEEVLVRRTEGELLAQGAAIAAAYRADMRRELESCGLEAAGPRVARPPSRAGDLDVDPEGRFHPLVPQIDLAHAAILPDGPLPRRAGMPDPVAAIVGRRLEGVLAQTQDATLAGIRLTDARGVIVASTSGGRNLSIANREEVRDALRGIRTSVLREKLAMKHPLGSISRNAGMRVVVALPVVEGEQLLGSVVLVRTPPSVQQALWRNRHLVLALGAAFAGAAVLVGLLTSRAVAGPVEELTRRAELVAAGDRGAAVPLRHPGTHEIARLSEAVSRMARTLDERADYLSTFAAHVSHEFKTPLASLRATAEVLREHGGDMTDEERERFLSNLDRDAERLDRLVGRLVEQARADMTRPAEDLTALAPIVERAIARFRASGLDITLERDDRAPEARARPEVVEAILVNLIDNARRHGGDGVHVTIGAKPERRGVVPGVALSVTDDGPGMSEANAAKAFTPFFTTARERGGTGLGLSIVRSLATAAGGSVELTSRPGRTEIKAWLPA